MKAALGVSRGEQLKRALGLQRRCLFYRVAERIPLLNIFSRSTETSL